MGDEHNPVLWNREKFHIIYFSDNDTMWPLLDNHERVLQEDYVPEDQSEALLRIFTSKDSAQKFLDKLPLKPGMVKYVSIVPMYFDRVLQVLEDVDQIYRKRGGFFRADVIDLDNEVEQREILFSRLIAKN